MGTKQSYYCKKCYKTMGADQFYGSNNLEKYPEGKLDICKKCISMHVDNWNPDTFIWILEECDVPYVPEEWTKLLATYGKDPSKMTGTTILGRYLSKMKLKQHKEYRFKDTEFLQQLADARIEQTMKRQGYDIAEITMAQENNKNLVIEGLSRPEGAVTDAEKEKAMIDARLDYFAQQQKEIEIDLTEEDKTYLLLKWGKSYKPEEWVRLEQLYEEMMQSYDIQGAGHIDTLKLICKTSLKANQLLDIGDIDAAQKMIRAYENLMKSGNFTAAQNKAESGDFTDAIGKLVEICEKEGFIPRYYIDSPKDRVDETLADMKNYTKSLVYEELNLGNLIEESMKAMMREENKDEDEDIEEELTLDTIDQLKDEDFQEHLDFLEEEADLDEKTLEELLGDD